MRPIWMIYGGGKKKKTHKWKGEKNTEENEDATLQICVLPSNPTLS